MGSPVLNSSHTLLQYNVYEMSYTACHTIISSVDAKILTFNLVHIWKDIIHSNSPCSFIS